MLQNSKKENMKKDKKSFKEYFSRIKLFIIIIFVISSIQIILSYLNVSVPKIFNSISIISMFKILIIIWMGFFLVSKEKLKLRGTIAAGAIFFIFELFVIFLTPSMFPKNIPLIFKLINYVLIIALNLAIFISASLLGGILSIIFKKLVNNKNISI